MRGILNGESSAFPAVAHTWSVSADFLIKGNAPTEQRHSQIRK
jgi:hypothetical protein